MNRFMGLIAPLAALIVMAAFVPAHADEADSDAAIKLLRDQIKTERKAVVEANLVLTSKQKENFWPLYREYHEKRDKLMNQRVAILKEFGENRIGITADKAEELLKNAVDLEKDIVGLKVKYRSKFVKVLLPRSALRYYQIENKIDTIINYDVAKIVPLQPM
jgi:Spy/CpxP family protein refolding chaperone